MKTAISIPDALFRKADGLARRLGVSRSELYAEAVARLLASRSEESVTERLNEIYGPNGESSRLEPRLAAMQRRTIRRRSA